MTLNDGTVIGKCTNFHDVHLGVVDPEPVKFSDLDPRVRDYIKALEEVAKRLSAKGWTMDRDGFALGVGFVGDLYLYLDAVEAAKENLP